MSAPNRYDLEFMAGLLIGSDRIPRAPAGWSAEMYTLEALGERVEDLMRDPIANARAQSRIDAMLRALPG